MAVIGRKIARGDLRLVRGDTQQIGARWLTLDPDTGVKTPKDLSGWSGRLELRSPDNHTLYASIPCAMTNDGYVLASIGVSDLSDPQWDARQIGQYKIVATHDGESHTLIWGYYTLSE